MRLDKNSPAELFFGPSASTGEEGHWIKTILYFTFIVLDFAVKISNVKAA